MKIKKLSSYPQNDVEAQHPVQYSTFCVIFQREREWELESRNILGTINQAKKYQAIEPYTKYEEV